MSVEGIRSIIRLHTGLHPKETGPIPHSEVVAMIASAKDGGYYVPRACRAIGGGRDVWGY